jgi:hypothetical protein
LFYQQPCGDLLLYGIPENKRKSFVQLFIQGLIDLEPGKGVHDMLGGTELVVCPLSL